MVIEIIKKCYRARFCLSCNYSCTLYVLVKILLIKSKNLDKTSACLDLNYGRAKQQAKFEGW